jgi:hypothetical protein
MGMTCNADAAPAEVAAPSSDLDTCGGRDLPAIQPRICLPAGDAGHASTTPVNGKDPLPSLATAAADVAHVSVGLAIPWISPVDGAIDLCHGLRAGCNPNSSEAAPNDARDYGIVNASATGGAQTTLAPSVPTYLFEHEPESLVLNVDEAALTGDTAATGEPEVLQHSAEKLRRLAQPTDHQLDATLVPRPVLAGLAGVAVIATAAVVMRIRRIVKRWLRHSRRRARERDWYTLAPEH